MTSTPVTTSVKDGWNQKPCGWNHIEIEEYQDDIFEGNLEDYSQEHLFVLAGGLDHLGRNHPWVKDRLDLALELYKIKPRKIYMIGGGTYHKPPHRNKENFVIHESTMGAKYLIDRGVNPDDISREWASYDTIANAFFGLLNFAIPLDLTDFVVITSDFHMPRAKAIFKWIFGLWSDKINGDTNHNMHNIKFLEVSSKYLDDDIIEARSKREARSLDRLKTTIKEINTWYKFHDWFYSDHQAYNCRFNSPREQIDSHTSASY
tara:strand:- start:5148 stop:5933 length:786 start_codon:yes stop_codon:yes gene_type:complete